MPNGICALAVSVAMQVGAPGPSETPNYPALPNAYNQYGFEGQFEQRFPLDSQQNWVHGYSQEIPAYGGHAFFRPYNYKDILSQSQVSAGWGQSPVLPYSQQFWHKYQDQATMLKLSRTEGAAPTPHMAAAPQQVMFLPTANSFVRQPAYVPQPVAPVYQYQSPTGYVPVQAAPVQAEQPQNTLPGPVLQPAFGQQYVDPASYVPRR